MLASCSGTTPATGGHPTATAKLSISPSITPPSAGGTCRLPVVMWTQTAQGQVPSEGFLTYPGGQFTSDANGGGVLEGTRYRTTAQPYLYGGGPGAGSYDRAIRRRLPAKEGR